MYIYICIHTHTIQSYLYVDTISAQARDDALLRQNSSAFFIHLKGLFNHRGSATTPQFAAEWRDQPRKNMDGNKHFFWMSTQHL